MITKPQKTLLICSFFIAGSACCFLFNSFFIWLVVLCFLLIVGFNKNIDVKLTIACILVFVFGFYYADFRIPAADDISKLLPLKTKLQGRVVSVPSSNLENMTKFYFDVYAYQNNKKWITTKSKTLISIYDYNRKFSSIELGDMLQVQAYLKEPFSASNPGQFDYKKYLAGKNIFSLGYVKYNGYKIIKKPESFIWKSLQALNRVKNKIIRVHKLSLKSPKLEVLGGMVFGDYAVPPPPEIKDSFIKSGLLHLLAASGMNVGIIFAGWYFLASRLFIPYKTKIIAGMILVAIYSLLTGLPPSVTRAALMLEFVLLGKLLDRTANNVILLVLVCALMLLYNPMMLTDVGFQLSYAVSLGLLITIPVILEKTKKLPEVLSAAVFTPLVAQLWATPIQVFHFNSVAVYSLIANILVLPFVGIISTIGFLGSLICLMPYIGEGSCFLLNKISEPFIYVLISISAYFSDISGALVFLKKPNVLQVLLLYTSLVLLPFVLKQNFKRKSVSFAFVVILLFGIAGGAFYELFSPRDLELTFFDVGQGDSILIKTPNNKAVLVDTGPSGYFSPAKTAVVPYLIDKGINSLDLLILTHPDNDHIGGTIDILEKIKVKKIYYNGINDDTKTYKSLEKYIDNKNIEYVVPGAGNLLSGENNVIIKAIVPSGGNYKSDNERSIILKVEYNDFSALLMADCEAEIIDLFRGKFRGTIDVMKIGHHGSLNSISDELIELLSPEIAIISVGKKGYKYPHPHPETIKTLRKYKVKYFRTDMDKAIKVTTNGKTKELKTFANTKDLF